MRMSKSDWSLGSTSSISSASTLTLCTANTRLRRPLQQTRWISQKGSNSAITDPVLLIAMLELESVESDSPASSHESCSSSQRFVTKLRIRASEVRTILHSRKSRHKDADSSSEASARRSVCSSDSLRSIGSHNCKDWIYTTRELRNKIRQYFVAVPSAALSPTWGYDVFIAVSTSENYVPLPLDERYNVVADFGTRWRIRLRERRRPARIYVATPETSDALQGGQNELDGSLTVSFQTNSSKDVSQKRKQRHSSQNTDLGGSIEDSSLFLARYLEYTPEVVRGKRVLEIGARGSGLSGLTAAKLGAKSVVVADCPDHVPQLQAGITHLASQIHGTTLGATMTHPGNKMSIRSLDWDKPDLSISDLCSTQHDVILLDDCIDMDRRRLFVALRSLLSANEEAREETKREIQEEMFATAFSQSCANLGVNLDGQHTSPVTSWSDIYMANSRSTDWSSPKIRSSTHDISCSTLHEAPPDEEDPFQMFNAPECSYQDETLSTLKRTTSTVSFDSLCDETEEDSPLSPQSVARLRISCPSTMEALLPPIRIKDTSLIRQRGETRVFVSYMCHHEAMHESLRTGLLAMFEEVEVLDTSHLVVPERYFLLSCQRLRVARS